jgi:hypothetical protein
MDNPRRASWDAMYLAILELLTKKQPLSSDKAVALAYQYGKYTTSKGAIDRLAAVMNFPQLEEVLSDKD